MKNQANNLKKGIIYAFIASIISGIAIFYAKISVSKIDPLILTTSRNLYVGIIFFIFLLVSRKFNQVKKIQTKQLAQLIFIGLIGGSIPFYLFFIGLQLIGAQNANIIHKSLFVWVSLLAVIFLKEKFNLIYLISFIFVFLGNFYFLPAKFSLGKGELLVFAATLFWAIENIVAKKILKNISSELVGLFRMGIGAITLLGFGVICGKSGLFIKLNFNQLLTIFVGGSILSFYVYFWYKALKHAPVSLVVLILTFSTVIGSILNGSFARVKIQLNDISSSLLITTAIFLALSQAFVNRSGGQRMATTRQ